MSATEGASGSAPLRPLPSLPSLEFEHKSAKRLLHDAQGGDPAAVARLTAYHAEPPDHWKLAHAQFALAREYGFASWPKLVAYFTTWQRHAKGQPLASTYRINHYEMLVQHALEGHLKRRADHAVMLATYAPRYFGLTDEEVFALPLTEDEARHVVARQAKFASWAELVKGASQLEPPMPTLEESRKRFESSVYGRAQAALRAEDLEALQGLVAEHPELLHPAEPDRHKRLTIMAPSGLPSGISIMGDALLFERRTRSARARELTDWLVTQGGDAQAILNRSLRGWMRATKEEFEWLIARGADPLYLPPNGVPLLDHVLLNCWDPGPAEVLRRYLTPRKALWIAAGFDDVSTMRTFFKGDGALHDSARHDRIDMTAVGLPVPTRPNASDRDILWEASMVAAFNHRWKAFDFLLARGLPIDYSPWGQNLLHVAVGNCLVPMVEGLVARGADLDLRGRQPDSTAREMAAERYRQDPTNPEVARVQAICCENRT